MDSSESSGNISVGSNSRVTLAPKWLGKRVGRFKLLALLGQGAMGRVFRAEDTLMGRHVALKMLPRSVKRGSTSIGAELLIREARAAASIEHPGAVQIYEINEAGDAYYIAMELLEGGTLKDLVKAAGPMDPTRACLLAAEAAEALAYAHSIGVIHRDVKPANLMLTRGGRCKVVDFGLARVDDPSNLTSFLAESVGTPQFVAPEILTGTHASAQSDIYSLAGTVWYLLTGHPPFEAGTAQELLRKHLYAPLPNLRSIRADIPQGLADALAKGLEKTPSARYASMDQFAKVLRVHTIPIAGSATNLDGIVAAAAVAATPPAMRPPSPNQPPPKPPEAVPTRPPAPSRRARPASPFESSSTRNVLVAPIGRGIEDAAARTQVSLSSAAKPSQKKRSGLTWQIATALAVLVVLILAVVVCVVLLKPPPSTTSTNTAPGNTQAAPSPATQTPPALTPVATPTTPPAPPAHPAPTFRLGDFEDQTDIGQVGRRGYMEFVADKHKYTVTGGGSDINGKYDSFHFVWRKMSGEIKIKAEIHPSKNGTEHNRKSCLMFRSSLEPDAAFADVAVLGDGSFDLQWRDKDGESVSHTHFPMKDMLTFELSRVGNAITLSAAKKGDPLKAVGTATVSFKDSVYVGPAVCAHNPEALETANFFGVNIKRVGPPKHPAATNASKPPANAANSDH